MLKRVLPMVLILVLAISLSACSNGDSNGEKNEDSAQAPQKVAALSSSFGEVWLLAGGELSMVTDDFFEERDLGVDEESVTLLGTVKEPNTELIIEENPDLVILSEDIDSHAKAEKVLNEAGIKTYKAKIEAFTDYLKTLKDFTELTGRDDLYEKNGLNVEKNINEIIEQNVGADADAKIVDDTSPSEAAPTALVLRAFSSGISVIDKDHVVCDILDNLNVTNIAAGNSSLTELSMESIISEDPDYIFLLTMGKESDAKKTLEDKLYSDPAWSDLTASQNDNVIMLPKDLFHYKPNARWGEAYEYIADIIYKK